MQVAVLGGTSGIGLAFARFWAKRNASLHLFSRGVAGSVANCIDYLESAGARSVHHKPFTAGSDAEHIKLVSHLSSIGPFDVIFIGGPSPPAGAENQVTEEHIQSAYKICIAYPLALLRSLSQLVKQNGAAYFLSSSSVDEDPLGHPFFLSCVFRRSMHSIIDQIKFEKGDLFPQIVYLKPRVVLTPLSIDYGSSLAQSSDLDVIRAALAKKFQVSKVPTADEYIEDCVKE